MKASLEAVSIGEAWLPNVASTSPAYQELLAFLRARGVPIKGPNELCGRERSFGSAQVSVLGPCPGADPNWSANDNSLVIRVQMGDRAMLLTGDAEHAAEAALQRTRLKLRSDGLKIGHHGSRTSTTAAFLEATRPEVALVSCGVRNRFDHPHPETVETLRRFGVPLLRTDRHGQLRWETDGQRVWITQTRNAADR